MVSATKVSEWMLKKEEEADKKMIKIKQMKKEAEAAIKPKEYKRAINFQDWLKIKDEEILAQKQEEEERRKLLQKNKITRRGASFENWIRASASKPKPVEIINVSTAKARKFPIRWQSIENWD